MPMSWMLNVASASFVSHSCVAASLASSRSVSLPASVLPPLAAGAASFVPLSPAGVAVLPAGTDAAARGADAVGCADFEDAGVRLRSWRDRTIVEDQCFR